MMAITFFYANLFFCPGAGGGGDGVKWIVRAKKLIRFVCSLLLLWGNRTVLQRFGSSHSWKHFITKHMASYLPVDMHFVWKISFYLDVFWVLVRCFWENRNMDFVGSEICSAEERPRGREGKQWEKEQKENDGLWNSWNSTEQRFNK